MQIHVQCCLINWWQIAVWASFGDLFFYILLSSGITTWDCNCLLHFASHTLLLYILLVFLFFSLLLLCYWFRHSKFYFVLWCKTSHNVMLEGPLISSYPDGLVSNDGWGSSLWPSYTMMTSRVKIFVVARITKKEISIQ